MPESPHQQVGPGGPRNLEHKWNLDIEESHAPTQQQIKYLRVIKNKKKKKRLQAQKIE